MPMVVVGIDGTPTSEEAEAMRFAGV